MPIELNEKQHQAIATYPRPYPFGQITSSQKFGQELEAEVSGGKDFYHPEHLMTLNTIVGIGSITKPFTAATLLKLWDMELTMVAEAKKRGEVIDVSKLWFPQGINTPISRFMNRLETRFADCKDLFTTIKNDENYSNITLAHLLNHSHGLGARNDKKAMDAVIKTGDRPLALSEIANLTEKREGEEFGKFQYGNFGFDLTAMVIEAVASNVKGEEISFDETLRELTLTPNGLNDTHPQSDHLDLYRDKNADVASGFFLDENRQKPINANFNVKSNTVAAGGFKSTVNDLTKFARLYFTGEMFENDQVKKVVRDFDGVECSDGTKYHLGMFQYKDGSIGHGGNDYLFESDLRLNPKTGEVFAGLYVIENITQHIFNQAFAKANPKDEKILKEFIPQLVGELKNSSPFPKPNSEEFKQAVEIAIDKAGNQEEILKAIDAYEKLSSAILEKYSPQELVDRREKIITEFSVPQEKAGSWAEMVGRSHHSNHSFVEEVESRGKKYDGKSLVEILGGSHQSHNFVEAVESGGQKNDGENVR